MKKIIKINLIILLILSLCVAYPVAILAEETDETSEETEQEEVVEEENSEEDEEETELDALENQKSELEETVSDSYLQLGVVQGQLSDTLYELEKININILEKQSEIQDLEAQTENLMEQIEETEAELEVQTELYNTQREQLRKRLVATYEMGSISYLDMLLTSKSLSEFVSNYYLISEIAKVDQELIEAYSETKANVENLSKTLETTKTILEQSKEKQEEAEIVLENMQIIQNNKLANLTDEERAIHDEIAAYEEEISSLEAEIRLLSLATVGSEYIGGEMAWPVPGYTKITSQFGMRTHPITGIYKLHTGVDISAPLGANFIAANDGVVVKAGYNTAYGNMVIIDHGGGIQTLYAHGTDILVEVGDVVRQGTPVLTVGSTGYSTGPHAHFEVRIDGTCVDPLDYITSYSSSDNSSKTEDTEEAEDTENTTEDEDNDTNTNTSTNETEE